MKLTSEWVTLELGGKKAQSYTVRPAGLSAPLPGVVLIQEAFGVDDFIQDVAERLATSGYAVMAPDLFSIGGKPEALSPQRVSAAREVLDTLGSAAWFDASARATAVQGRTESERKKLIETFDALLPAERPWDLYVAALKAGRTHLSQTLSKGRRVGSLGFCLGGALSMRLACTDADLAAAVVFYGVAPPLELLDGLKAPLLGLYAEKDPRVTGGLPALERALKDKAKSFEHHVYPNALHAFMNDTRPNYDVETARDAWAKALTFLAARLGPTTGP